MSTIKLAPDIIEMRDDFLACAKELRFGELHIKLDEASGLQTIIAIHSTKNGPALGGTRFIEYNNINDAIRDALRLAEGMSRKAAAVGLPLGGGKAVIMKPKHIPDREAFFRTFGRFVNELNGRFITAVDSGTSVEDMDIVNQETPYIASSSKLEGDPSPYTAEGVFQGIRAAVNFKLNKQNLDGIKVAIQGLGHVGFPLAKRLHEQGAILFVTDVDSVLVQRCVQEFNATAVNPRDIYEVDCDVFAPCALGAILNSQTIPKLRASIVAGGANNQLANYAVDGKAVQRHGILYAPDYAINSGGLIYAATEYIERLINNNNDGELIHLRINEKIQNIYYTLTALFDRAASENLPTNEIMDRIVNEKLY